MLASFDEKSLETNVLQNDVFLTPQRREFKYQYRRKDVLRHKRLETDNAVFGIHTVFF